ncbi:MAG: CNNM domain-containing protein [Rheinheimera sp.]|nr:CNNM domain-containing protein [Rheinheimera sp.]
MIGEAAFTPYFVSVVEVIYQGPWLQNIGFGLSVFFVTTLFILFADLMPKRLAMLAPEKVAMTVVRPIMTLLVVLRPLVMLFNGVANV